MAVIAIDLGGTKLAGALFSHQGLLLSQTVVPLDSRKGRAVGRLLGEQVMALIQSAHAKSLVVGGIGVSVPGISRVRSGTVWAPNIPGWENYPLRQELQAVVRRSRRTPHSSSNIPIIIDNDRACSLLGETWRGVAKRSRNAIFLAVGTGIGAGIMSDGRVLRGADDIAGAIGWLALDRPFRSEYIACGCFEHHASGIGLAKVANELAAANATAHPGSRSRGHDRAHQSFPSAHELFAAYARGDRVAKKVFANAIEFWGMAVANLVSLFNPEQIIFGGGVFGPATKFLGLIYAEAKKWAQPVSIRQVKLLPSKLGADAPLYGAAYVALHP
jgi:glucokinase